MTNLLKGLLLKPESKEMEEITFDLDRKEKVIEDIKKIIGCTEIASLQLPSPLENVVYLMDEDMLNTDSKYNFSLLGLPIFGNALFVPVTDTGEITNTKEELLDFCKRIIEDIKYKESCSGLYDKISKMDKSLIAKEVCEDINNLIEEVDSSVEN